MKETRHYHLCGSDGRSRLDDLLGPFREGAEVELFLHEALPTILEAYQGRLLKDQEFYFPIARDIRHNFSSEAKIKVVSRSYELGNGNYISVQKSRFIRSVSLDLVVSSNDDNLFQMIEDLGFRETHFAYNPESFIPNRNAPAYRN